MGQAQIYEVLRQYKGQKLTASQIAYLVGERNKAIVIKQLGKLREYGVIKWADGGSPTHAIFYYL